MGWDQLQSKTLGAGSSGSDINAQSKDVHIQEVNRGVMEDVILVNQASMRQDGGPIPGTGVLTTVTVTDNTITNFLTPNPGEVWQVESIGSDATGRSGSLTWQFYSRKTDGSASSKIYYYAASTDQPAFPGDADYRGLSGFLCDENVTLAFGVGGSFSETDMHIHAIRIR